MDIPLIIFFGGLIAAFVAILAVALYKPLLAVTPVAAPAVMRDIAYRLRVLGYPVDAGMSPVKLTVDSLSVVKIHVRPGTRGTEIRYEVDATGLGWTLVLILMFSGYLGIASLIIALYIHASAAKFARNRVLPAIGRPPLGTLPGPDVRSFLVEGLSEAQRLASEALEWEREARQNAVGLIVIGSIVLWVATLFSLATLVPPIPGALVLDFLLATVASASAAALGSWAVYRHSRPVVLELQQDAETYRAALVNEVFGGSTPQATRGGLELLLHAAQRSPRWREIRRRRKRWHDPWTGFTIFAFAEVTFLCFLFAIIADFLSVEWRIGLAIIGSLSVLGGFQTVRSERREIHEQDERDRTDWERRRQEIETTLWKLLSG